MFIRVTRPGTDALYECNRLLTVQNGSELFLTMERDNGFSVTVMVDKDEPGAVGIYAMNDRGQTVDTIFRKD